MMLMIVYYLGLITVILFVKYLLCVYRYIRSVYGSVYRLLNLYIVTINLDI